MSAQRTWQDAEREANDQRAQRLRDKAEPDCRICRGRGQVSMHVAGDKYGASPCPCTGEACWQQ